MPTKTSYSLKVIKTVILTTLTLVTLTVFSQKRPTQKRLKTWDEMCWWYEKPATKYWEGLPIGTGRFAAMVLGKIGHEEIPFNDETLWSGGPYNPNNKQGPEILSRIRKFALEKDYVKATAEAAKLGSIPRSVQHYQPMGILHLAFDNETTSTIESHSGEVSLLPALPKAWAKGQISGLRARGGYTVDISWENNAIKKAKPHAKYNGNCSLRTKTPVHIIMNGKPVLISKPAENVYVFKVLGGKNYLITGK